MSDSQSKNTFAEQQEAIRHAGETMQASLLQQMRENDNRPSDFQSMKAFTEAVQAQVKDFVSALESTIREQVNSFATEAKDIQQSERKQ